MEYFIKLKLIEQLDSDSILRTELALALKITERAVYNTVRRYLADPVPNSSLTKIAAMNFFKSKGLAEDDIITTEKPVV